MEEHYKQKYLYYKNKCMAMENVFGRLQEVLEAKPQIPFDSPSTPVASASASTSEQSGQGPDRSPILGRNVRRRILFQEKPVEASDSMVDVEAVSESDSDEDLTDFEPGSNKWECQPLISSPESVPSSPLLDMNRNTKQSHGKDAFKPASSSKSGCSTQLPLTSPENSKYDADHPLARLRKLRHSDEMKIMTNNPLWNRARQEVSSRIHGVKRKELPGWDCYKCAEYYVAAGLENVNINSVSRHRSTHKRLASPPGLYDLDLDRLCKRCRKD